MLDGEDEALDERGVTTFEAIRPPSSQNVVGLVDVSRAVAVPLSNVFDADLTDVRGVLSLGLWYARDNVVLIVADGEQILPTGGGLHSSSLFKLRVRSTKTIGLTVSSIFLSDWVETVHMVALGGDLIACSRFSIFCIFSFLSTIILVPVDTYDAGSLVEGIAGVLVDGLASFIGLIVLGADDFVNLGMSLSEGDVFTLCDALGSLTSFFKAVCTDSPIFGGAANDISSKGFAIVECPNDELELMGGVVTRLMDKVVLIVYGAGGTDTSSITLERVVELKDRVVG